MFKLEHKDNNKVLKIKFYKISLLEWILSRPDFAYPHPSQLSMDNFLADKGGPN